jgi:Mg2+ and Co2+ transporter CorA
MAKKLLTDSEVLEIVYNSDESFRNSSSDSVSSSDNEINNNNNIYLQQLGCHSVVVVMLHVYKT